VPVADTDDSLPVRVEPLYLDYNTKSNLRADDLHPARRLPSLRTAARTHLELMMSVALTVLSLAIVALVLARDWGHRKVTLFALLRPLIGVIIIPFVAPGWTASGHGLVLEIAALAVGIALGLLTFAFMKVSVDASGQEWTDAGYPYAAAWIVIAAIRLILIYGTEHWFTRQVGTFLVNNHISVNAFADSIIFLSIGPVVVNRLAILVRIRTLSSARRVTVPTA
jgi:hypothetical protein